MNINKIFKITNENKAFSLVELMVAVFILSISFMAILPLLWNTTHVNQSTTIASKARDVAVQKVEELMSLPRDVYDTTYSLATNTSYTSPVEYVTENGEVTTNTAAMFQRTFRVDQVPGVLQDPKPVILTSVVTYKIKGETKSRGFSTMWSF